MTENAPDGPTEEATRDIIEQLVGVEAFYCLRGENDEVSVRAHLTTHPRMILDIGVVDLWLDGEFVGHEAAQAGWDIELAEGEVLEFEGYIEDWSIEWRGPGLPELDLEIARA